MPKFNLYFGMEQEQYNLHVVENVELPSLEEAKKEVREYAEDLYMQNPVRDIIEIMKEENIDFEIAKYRFQIDMFRKTIYHIEELVEMGGEVVEVLRHDFKYKK